MIEVAPANVVVSALKGSREGAAVLRVYEAAGEFTGNVVIRLPEGATGVDEVDLMEDRVGDVEVVEGEARLSLRPFEIKTLKFGFRAK